MNNPISEKARGIIYVISIVASGAGVIAAPVLAAAGMQSAVPIVAAAVAGIGGTAALLARANLSSPVIGMSQEQVEQVAKVVWENYVHQGHQPLLPLGEVEPREPEAQALPTGL